MRLSGLTIGYISLIGPTVVLLCGCWSAQESGSGAPADDTASDADADSDTGTGEDPFEGLDPGDLAWAVKIEDETAWDVAARDDNSAVVLTLPGGAVAFDADGEILWTTSVVETDCYGNQECFPRGIAALPDGGFAVVGDFEDDAVFGAAGEEVSLSGELMNTQYLYLARFDAQGDLLWVRGAAGAGYSIGTAVAAAADGGFVVLGEHGDGAMLGKDETEQTVLEAIGPKKVFLARFTADGSLAWASSIGGSYGGGRGGVALMPDGAIMVTVEFVGTVVLGEGEPNETTFNSEGNYWSDSTFDVFTARFGSTGKFEWVSKNAGEYDDEGRSVEALTDSASVACGSFYNEVTFGSGQDDAVPLGTFGNYDGFLTKYRADGALDWVRRMGGLASDRTLDVAVTLDGEPVVTGYFRWDITFDAGDDPPLELEAIGTEDMFVARYDSSGTVDWATNAGGGPNTYGRAVDVTPDGGILVVGSYTQKATFGQGEPNETAFSVSDSFLAKFAP